MAVAVLAGTFGGYTLEMLGRATQWDDEPAAEPSYFRAASRAAAARTAGALRPAGAIGPMPREHVEQAQAVELLPEPVREALERARVDASAPRGAERDETGAHAIAGGRAAACGSAAAACNDGISSLPPLTAAWLVSGVS